LLLKLQSTAPAPGKRLLVLGEIAKSEKTDERAKLSVTPCRGSYAEAFRALDANLMRAIATRRNAARSARSAK
jgi:hypothetical protein